MPGQQYRGPASTTMGVGNHCSIWQRGSIQILFLFIVLQLTKYLLSIINYIQFNATLLLKLCHSKDYYTV